jgi:hypothetical protein
MHMHICAATCSSFEMETSSILFAASFHLEDSSMHTHNIMFGVGLY